MKNLIGVLALALVPTLAAAAEKPDWAFPVTDKVQPAPRFEASRVRPAPPGSTLSITRAKADDMYDIPNWFPNMYPAMPAIVQYGNKEKQVRACGSCHLPTGTGHDESAYVAGLPAAYFIRQMADWKSGDRKFSATMVTMAKVVTDAEIKDAADYFASLKPRALDPPGRGRHRAQVLHRPGQQAASSSGRRHRAVGQPHHRSAGRRGGRCLPRSHVRLRRLR